jgi:hypothetical protein
MTTGTTHMGGFVTAGAARPGACLAALSMDAGSAALAYTWLEATDGKQGFHRFIADRPNRRPRECFP